MAGWRSTKASHSTGYSNAIVCPNNALIGGDNCGVGRKRGAALFQSVGHRNKRRGGKGGGGGGWEAQVPDGESGIDPQRARGTGVFAGLSTLIKKTKEKIILRGKTMNFAVENVRALVLRMGRSQGKMW